MATNFGKLSAKYRLNGAWIDHPEYACLDEGNAPCYSYRASTHDLMTAAEIPVYLRACQRETIGVVLVSVTEMDVNHKQFIAAAKLIKGATVTRGRSTNHGGYPCWLIALPGTAKA